MFVSHFIVIQNVYCKPSICQALDISVKKQQHSSKGPYPCGAYIWDQQKGTLCASIATETHGTSMKNVFWIEFVDNFLTSRPICLSVCLSVYLPTYLGYENSM